MWRFLFNIPPSRQNKTYNRFVGSVAVVTLLVLIALMLLFSSQAHSQIITFVSSATASTSGTSITITKPAGIITDDVLIAHIAHDASGAITVTPPAGWVQIRALNNTNYIFSVTFYKVATTSEPANYTFTAGGGTIWTQSGGILAYRGVDTGSPIDVENGVNTVSSTSHATPSVTTTTANTMILAFYAVDYLGAGPWTPPAGMTEQYDVNGTYEDIEAADALQVLAGVTGAKTATCTSADKGTAQIMALRPASPMTYVSSTTTQTNTSSVAINTTNNEVIGIQIVTSGSTSPLSATNFSLNTTGTTAPATDITNAKLWYTGTNSSFATTTQFGTTVAAPNGAFTFTGTQTLSSGTNYFWLTYDVPAGATVNNFIDGECTSLTVTIPRTPTVTAPAGSRQITPLVAPTYQCQSVNNSSGTSLVITKPACVAVNDLMLAHITARSTAFITAPAGWTVVFQNMVSNSTTSAAFYKVATGAEPASYTFTSDISDNSVAILVYRGVDVTDPIETSGIQTTAAGTSHTTPCITATTDQTMVVALFGLSSCSSCNLTDVNFTAPAGMTERYDLGMIQSSSQGEAGYDVVQATKGCVQKTATSFASTAGNAGLVILRPSGGNDFYSTVYNGGSSNFVATGAVTLARPTVKQNDLMVAHLSAAVTVTGPGATPPAGWTLLRFDLEASGIGSWIYYKVAGASEAGTYSFAVSSGINLMGAIRAYRGIDPVTPLQTSAGASVPSGTSYSTPSITTTADSSLVLTFYTAYAQVSFTPPANANERYDYANAQNHWKTISGDDFILTPAGGTGAKTATSSSSAVGLAQIASFNRLSGKVSGACCGFLTSGPLPVEWFSFTAKLIEEKKVKLNWATAAEMNNDYFSVEKSMDGKSFETIGTVQGAGNSSTIKNYSFTDYPLEALNPESETFIYYRIKQTDYDGNFDYSSITSVFIAPVGFYISELFPNPADNMTNVFVSSSDETSLSVIQYNSMGQKISSSVFLLTKGSNQVSLNVSNFIQGIYTLSFSTEKQILFRKITILNSSNQ